MVNRIDSGVIRHLDHEAKVSLTSLTKLCQSLSNFPSLCWCLFLQSREVRASAVGEWGDFVHHHKHLEQSQACTSYLICISVVITLYTDEETGARVAPCPSYLARKLQDSKTQLVPTGSAPPELA